MHTRARFLLSSFAVVLFAACGEDDGGSDDSLFECAEGRDGWEQCVDDVVHWCHATDDPHFHTGRNCAEDGLVCSAANTLGYCADPELACEDGTPGMCEDRLAVNCVNGMTGYRRCGVGTACAVNADGWAVCEEL